MKQANSNLALLPDSDTNHGDGYVVRADAGQPVAIEPAPAARFLDPGELATVHETLGAARKTARWAELVNGEEARRERARELSTAELLAEVEELQGVQKAHAPSTEESETASVKLAPLFVELARRQRAGDAEAR